MADSRDLPLAGRAFASRNVALDPAPEARRIILRSGPRSRSSLSAALGIKLPGKPKTTTSSPERAALWQGPDEWLIIDFENRDVMTELIGVKTLHSAVDISHRNCGLLVVGPHATKVLNAGCPLNLSLKEFPVGAATRTVMGKVEIVLWRQSDEQFHVECWRSFSDYLFVYLQQAAVDWAS